MIRFGFSLAAIVLVADQLSKWLILTHVMDPFSDPLMGQGRVIEVTSFFNVVMVWNQGVSFGLFSNDSPYGPWLLSGVALVISGFLTVWLRKAENRLIAAALGLVIGGAIGNVIDRLRFGAVADFLDFHLAGWHWPAFNIADAAIVIGVGLILIEGFLPDRFTNRLKGATRTEP